MTMKNLPDCAIGIIPIESLKKYYKPEEITGYCKGCPRYEKNWSCPPHNFNVIDYIEQYKMAYAIGVKVSLAGFSKKADSMNYYYDCRRSINRRLLQYETEISYSKVLIGGHCDLCENCTRAISLECNFPDKQRHSLESLGFKVSEIIEDLFDDKLQWNKGKTPDNLYIVLGLLSKESLDLDELRSAVIGSCNNIK